MDLLGRFYTKDVVSDLLVQNLISKFPAKILDLGIGNASLTIAAYKRWSKAKYFATEIENHKVKSIEKQLSFVKVYNYDSLKPNLSTNLKIKYDSIDVAICNPPYFRIKEKEKYKKLFKDAGCKEFIELRKLSSEIVFFAHNLSLLKPSGELGIIVSDSLITGKEFCLFREILLNKFDLRTIIQLPDNIFNKTEARTYILILSKSKPNTNFCSLYKSDTSGVLSDCLKVPRKKLVERMDYQFYDFVLNNNVKTFTLSDIGAKIKRGNFSKKELELLQIPFTHSTNFSQFAQTFQFKKAVNKKYSAYKTNPGDILMCRVGKRCVGRIAIIETGSTIISDCVFGITVPEKYRNDVFESLISAKGKAWLKAYSHGVCSQLISKEDLLTFPISFPKK